VISSPVDERFDGIQLISLVELNAMAARHRLKTFGYDSRLIKNLDCDARIILTWDADNADIDLWVSDTLAEKCFYGHNLSESGGRMSNEFTDGCGPEEFLIREAMHGKYRVEVNYYRNRQQVLAGATTVQVIVFPNWGRKNQKSEVETLRLKESQEVIFVGEFELR
jgi:Ca-activated chloride channel family protein